MSVLELLSGTVLELRDRRKRPRHRRASVAIFVAMLAPVLAGATALGIEVSNWAVTKLEMQRTADAAAVAGMLRYQQASNAQAAALAAIDLAEINGADGSNSPIWDNTSQTLTANNITAQFVSGVRNSSDAALKVTVKKSIPLMVSRIISHSQSSVTVAATSYAELVSSGASSGGQPCMLALGGGVDGITNSTDLTFSGNVNIYASNCNIRSDDGMSFNGNISVTAAGIYTGGTLTQSGSVVVSAPIYENAGEISDPYANWTELQNALSAAKTATGPTIDHSNMSDITLNPGNYTGISITGSSNVTLNPGLYIVNGDISLAGSSNITGHGVTIISSGTLNTTGSSYVDLTAPTTSTATGGSIPGILFASSSTASSNFTGSSGLPFTGALYYPNGPLVFAGAATDGSNGCAEIVAKSITMSGSVQLSANCSTYGLPSYGSSTPTLVAKIVQ